MADPDLQIRGGGSQKKKIFPPLGPQSDLKIRGPLPWSATGMFTVVTRHHKFKFGSNDQVTKKEGPDTNRI